MKPTIHFSASVLAAGLILVSCQQNGEEVEGKASGFSENDGESVNANRKVDPVVEWDEENGGDPVSLKVGQTLRIRLEGNSSTGFSWTPQESDSALYEWVKKEAKPASDGDGRVGRGGCSGIRRQTPLGGKGTRQDGFPQAGDRRLTKK